MVKYKDITLTTIKYDGTDITQISYLGNIYKLIDIMNLFSLMDDSHISNGEFVISNRFGDTHYNGDQPYGYSYTMPTVDVQAYSKLTLTVSWTDTRDNDWTGNRASCTYKVGTITKTIYSYVNTDKSSIHSGSITIVYDLSDVTFITPQIALSHLGAGGTTRIVIRNAILS